MLRHKVRGKDDHYNLHTIQYTAHDLKIPPFEFIEL